MLTDWLQQTLVVINYIAACLHKELASARNLFSFIFARSEEPNRALSVDSQVYDVAEIIELRVLLAELAYYREEFEREKILYFRCHYFLFV